VSHGATSRPVKNVFVGRDNEVAVLRSAWHSVRSGSARVVAIEGDPGIGKTALIENLLAQVQAPVIRVTGVRAESLAPWRVLEAITARLAAADPARKDPQASPASSGRA
jgi:Cdc6-like AAA superfamily ATPase